MILTRQPCAQTSRWRTPGTRCVQRRFYDAAQETVLDVGSRRKLAVHILGSEAVAAEAAEATGAAQEEPGTAAHADENGAAVKESSAAEKRELLQVEVIARSWEFKRAQEVYASP